MYTPNIPGYTYQWLYNGVVQSTSNTYMFDVAVHLPFLSSPLSQDFILIVTDQYGCQDTLINNIILKPCKFIIISPNPFPSKSIINYSYSDAKEVRFELLDLKGNLLEVYYMNEVSGFYEINMMNFSDGMYLLNVYVDNEFEESIKLMKSN